MNPLLLLPIRRFLGRLRHPQLFGLMGVLFLVTLVVPDPIPLVDELLLLVATLVFGSLKRRRGGDGDVDGNAR